MTTYAARSARERGSDGARETETERERESEKGGKTGFIISLAKHARKQAKVRAEQKKLWNH